MTRKCRACRAEKAETDFDSPERKTCAKCREKEKAWYEENKEQIRARQRERWRCRSQSQKETDSSKRHAYRIQHREELDRHNQVYYREHRQDLAGSRRTCKLKRVYGLTLEEFDSLLEKQGGHCAVCDRACEEDGKHLSVDHDHETGKVRGLLCARHNHALGLCGDDPDVLMALASYLIRHKKR